MKPSVFSSRCHQTCGVCMARASRSKRHPSIAGIHRVQRLSSQLWQSCPSDGRIIAKKKEEKTIKRKNVWRQLSTHYLSWISTGRLLCDGEFKKWFFQAQIGEITASIRSKETENGFYTERHLLEVNLSVCTFFFQSVKTHSGTVWSNSTLLSKVESNY